MEGAVILAPTVRPKPSLLRIMTICGYRLLSTRSLDSMEDSKMDRCEMAATESSLPGNHLCYKDLSTTFDPVTRASNPDEYVVSTLRHTSIRTQPSPKITPY